MFFGFLWMNDFELHNVDDVLTQSSVIILLSNNVCIAIVALTKNLTAENKVLFDFSA